MHSELRARVLRTGEETPPCLLGGEQWPQGRNAPGVAEGTVSPGPGHRSGAGSVCVCARVHVCVRVCACA